MEYPFSHLVSTKITRLLRPKLSLSSNPEHSIIPSTAETLTQSTDETTSYNDVGEPYAGFDNMFLFPTKFGYGFLIIHNRGIANLFHRKMYVGQTFRGVISICNLSKTYPLTKVHIRVLRLFRFPRIKKWSTHQREFYRYSLEEMNQQIKWNS